MELRHLKYFAKTAELLHFSRAADELGIAQSALSQQIKQLESEIGCRLFDRSNKWKIELTDAGKVFLEDARKIISSASTAKRKALQASMGGGGSLSISIIPSFFSSDKFFAALETMRKRYPNVFLRLSKHSSANILSRVESGELDFGIIRVINPASLATRYIELGREKIVLAIPQKHRFASKKSISLRELKDEKFIMVPYEESPFFCQTIDVALKREGIIAPNVASEIYNFDAILKSIPNSDLVSFVPEMLQTQGYKGVLFKPIEGLNASTLYAGVWLGTKPKKTLENFLALLKKSFQI